MRQSSPFNVKRNTHKEDGVADEQREADSYDGTPIPSELRERATGENSYPPGGELNRTSELREVVTHQLSFISVAPIADGMRSVSSSNRAVVTEFIKAWFCKKR